VTRVPLRDAYRAIRSYDTDAKRYPLELADNTSPFGPSPSVRAALERASQADLTRYPSTYSRSLRASIAAYIGVAADEVMVGAGSDEVLSCTFRALGDPGAVVAHMHPTFVMARVFAETNSLRPVAVGLTPAGDADADALLATGAVMMYLCTPNNPTGGAIGEATLARVVHDARGLVIVDEAYAEYAGTNLAARAPATDGMLVLRTFSKAFGLAGARVGYAVGSRTLIAELEKARGPYTVSALSEWLAQTALDNDVAWVLERASEVRETREWFAAALGAAGHPCLPSAANFVLVPVPDAAAAQRALADREILVRSFASLPGVGDALRISMARRDDMSRVLACMREVLPVG
jgi:histidinol-phosphate aminotransferase